MKEHLEYTETLPTGFRLRQATIDDLQAITDLVIATDIAERGTSDFSMEELKTDWQKPDFDLARDAWVVTTPDGQVAGYEESWNRFEHARLEGDGYVHPDFTGLGIGTALLRVLEARAREHIPLAPPEARVILRNGLFGDDLKARSLHENEGYQPIRYLWRMEIEMVFPPDPPQWPEGIQLRTFVPDLDERPVFDAFEDAFRDHWGYVPWNYEWWRQRLEREGFEPGLNFLAFDGEQIAGGALCHYREQDGWVHQLAVRRPWRRMGLGLALLQHAFGEFYRRGTRKVGLGVDASNPTGATHLYQRAGMQVAHEYVVYEKELRPGREV